MNVHMDTSNYQLFLDVARPDRITSADINAVCQEVSIYTQHTLRAIFVVAAVAKCVSSMNKSCCMLLSLQGGMHAVRENRYIVLTKDFEKAYKKVVHKDDQEHEFYK